MLADTREDDDTEEPDGHADAVPDAGWLLAAGFSFGSGLGEIDEGLDEERAHELGCI